MDEAGAGAGGGGGGAVLREDGYLRSALAAASVRFHAGLNVLLLRSTAGELHVIDVHSGLVLQSSRLSSENGVLGVEYVPGAERVLVWDLCGVSARTDYNGVLLLHTALQQPLTAIQQDQVIKIELFLSEAVLLFQCLETFDSLTVEGLADVKEELKKAINVKIPKKGVKAQKWSTVCLELPQSTLRSVSNAVVSELKSQNRRIPALAIASAVGQRASELAPPTRTKDTRALMYSEAARRETFKRWPHMDYKWALPAQMSQAGFYHQPSTTGDDRAICFSCLVCLVCWEKSDEPWVEHERHSPNCAFVRGEYTHNVPISVANATSCAVPSRWISVVSQGNTGNLVATGITEGIVTIWKLDCGMKQFKHINVSPYDSIFSGILTSDCNKVWGESFEKDQYIYSLKLTAMSFVGLLPEESYPQPSSGDNPDKTQTSKDRPKPALICAVTVTRTETSQSNPSIHEDNTSEKNLFNSGTDSPSNEYVKAMNDQNQGRNKNKSLYLLTYDVHGSVAASTTTVVQSAATSAASNTGGPVKPGGSKKAPAVRTDDSNIYDEIYFQFSDEDVEMSPCHANLMEDSMDMMVQASSSKEVDAKIWEPKKIIVTKQFKMYPNKIYPMIYPPNSNSSNIQHPISMLPELLGNSEVSESVQNFVGHISNLKKWKAKDSESSNNGTKVTDQTDSAVLQSADGIHYINMNGPLEISDLKWYGEEKAYGKTGTQTSANNGNSEGFDSDTAEEILQVCVAIQCLGLPNKLILRDDSQVTHLLPTIDGKYLLVVVSHNEKATTPNEVADGENIDMDEIYRFMNGKPKSSNVSSEASTPAINAGAYLILYKVDDKTSTLTLDENSVAFEELAPGLAPLDLCMLPGGKNDQPSVAIVGEDGTLRLYSLPDLCLLTQKSIPQNPFVSVTFCSSVERLSVCTGNGTLHFYALSDGDSDSIEDTDEDEAPNLEMEESQKPLPTEGLVEPVLIAHKQSIDCDDIDTLLALTSTTTSVPYVADVPGFWCELSPAQRPRSDHLNNRTWRLQNTSSTWDEHILELTLPSSMNLAHIQLQFTLHPSQPSQNLPFIQVTLLKQNLNGIGYEKDVTAMLNEPTTDTKSSQKQEENLDHLKAHDAEIIAGPLLLSSGLDLTMQSGSLTLTSPRLYRAKGKTFLVHIKTMFDPSKDMIKCKNSEPTAKKADYIGCDWLHQISIAVRKYADGPQERQQRIAMLESNQFLSNLLALATDCSDVERMKRALDLSLWIISIRLQRFRVVSTWTDVPGSTKPDDAPSQVEVQQIECIKIVEKNIDALIKNCILKMKRSIAKKCIKIILITSEGAKNIPRVWESTFDSTLAEVMSNLVSYLGACVSPGSMCWLSRLAMHAGSGSATALKSINNECLKLLEMLAVEVESRPDRYHSLLRARFGLYGLPLERNIFDAEGPALGKSSSSPVTYASVLAGDTSSTASSPYPKPDHQLKDLYNIASEVEAKKGSNSNAWWTQPSGPGVLSAGKLESMALHVTCHTASDGTKLEQSGGRQPMSAVSAFAGDTSQLWGAVKCDSQLKHTISQESDSLEDGENSIMECDAQDKAFTDDRLFKEWQESDACGIPWSQLVMRPSQPTLVVERMHSGARRFIVLDFGHPVRLTDLIIPPCSDLVTLSVDYWLHSEEQDGTKLVFATDISTKTLLLTDIQPPPLCRFIKITTIGRYGMSAMKCKIPLGYFYGEIAEIANPQASISALASLQQDLACRFRLATAKLRDLLNPYLEQYNGNASHMMAFLKSPSESDLKVEISYQECIELQQQLHTVSNVLEKLQTETGSVESGIAMGTDEWSPKALLAAASTDKLRVMTEHLLHILLYFNSQLTDVKTEEISSESCSQISRLLWVNSPRPATALATLLAKLCGSQPWWGKHLADTLVKTFAAVDAPPIPQDRCLILIIYMARKTMLASPRAELGVVSALVERALIGAESGREPALASSALVVLAACLDNLPGSTGWGRWDFVTGGRAGAGGATESTPQSAQQLQRRKIHKKLVQQMQEAVRKTFHKSEDNSPYRLAALHRRVAAVRAAEHDSTEAPLLPLVSSALAAKLVSALLSRLLTVDHTTNADVLILSAKVVGRLCAISPGMVGLVGPSTVLELLRLAATLPPWPRHAIINLLQDLVEYENSSLGDRGAAGRGGPPAGGSARTSILVCRDDGVMHYTSRMPPLNIVKLENKPGTVTPNYKDLKAVLAKVVGESPLPQVLESEDTPSDDWLDQYYTDAIKRTANPKTNITNTHMSVCGDARLEGGAESCGEVMARRLLLRGSESLALAILTPGLAVQREPETRRAVPSPQQPFAQILAQAFEELAADFAVEDDCKFMENVISLWLTLNGSPSYNPCGISPSVPSEKPRILLSAETVNLLLASLVELENVSLRCWVLSMQAIAWIANLPLNSDGVSQTMGRVILDSDHFVNAVIKFVNSNVASDGTVNSGDSYLGGTSVGAGTAATSVLQIALARVISGRGALGAYAALRCVCGVRWRDTSTGCAHDLRSMLLHTALSLVRMLTAKHAQHAVSLMDTVAYLTCDWMSTKRSGISETPPANSSAESGTDTMLTANTMLTGLLADAIISSDGSKGGGRKTPCHRTVLLQLLQLCRMLLVIPLNAQSENQRKSEVDSDMMMFLPSNMKLNIDGSSFGEIYTNEGMSAEHSAADSSQTDESKQQQQQQATSSGNADEDIRPHHAKHACVTDIVLQHKPTMQRLFRALSLCQAPISTDLSMDQLSGEPTTVWEELLRLVGTLTSTASHPSLVLTTLLDVLKRRGNWVLSDALVWFILRSLEKPEALSTFIEMDGIEVITQRLSSCHYGQLSSRPGLVSSLMNYLKLPPQLINLSTPASSNSKKTQVAPVETPHGLLNFAPLCTVSCGNPTAQAADVLLGGGANNSTSASCAARRARSAAWSYHFFSAEDTSLALTLTLPYAVQLHEVQLQPHVNSLATCPGAVGIEVGNGGTLSPLGPPQNTTGVMFIRLVITQPVIATTVQIILYKPRDSSNMGLLHLRLLGTPVFSNVPSAVSTGVGSSGWIRILSLCVGSGRMDTSRWASVVRNETINACTALLTCGAPASQHAHAVLLAAALTVPTIQHPLMRRLLSMDALAHSRAYQFNETDNNAAVNAICELLYQLCEPVDEYSRDRLETYLAWLAECADAYRERTEQTEAHAPSSAFVQCLAEVLWTAKENVLMERLEEIIPDALFESINTWVKHVPENCLLKKALDSVLCSICYIRPDLFRVMLQEIESTFSNMEQDNSSDGIDCLTDDGKVRWEGDSGCLRVTPSQLTTVATVAMSPHATTMLLQSSIPARVADAIKQFSLHKLQSMNKSLSRSDAHMTDADKATDKAMSTSTYECIDEPVSLSMMLVLVDWARGLCADRRLKDWLGGPQGSQLWRPLLLALCLHRADRSWREGELVAELEEKTIQLFSALTTCHPANQKLFARTLHQILETDTQGSGDGSGISGFTRALILRLLLSSERATVSVRWAPTPADGIAAPTPAVPGRHPSLHRQCVLTVPLHTTVRTLLREHIAPVISASKWSGSINSGGSGTNLQRSASDSGLLTNLETFELSVMAARTAKDKRSKDPSNNSLKQQVQKRLRCRVAPAQNSTLDDEPITLRVQSEGIDGVISPNVTIGQLSACSPHVFGPHVKLTILSCTNKSEGTPLWETDGAESGRAEGGGAVLREFSAVGGLALFAAQLPRPRPAPHAPAPSHSSTHDFDWVKLDDSYEEVVELGVGSAPSTEESAGCTGVPPHALLALGLLLKLPGYAEALLNEGPRAVHLLRLLLGVTDDEDGRMIVVSGGSSTASSTSGPRSLGTLPFRVVSGLLEAAPRSTDDGRLLRRSLLAVGAVRLVFACLAVFTHQQPETPGESQGSNGSSTKSRVDDKNQLYWAKGTGYGTGSTQQSWNVEQALVRQRTEEEHVTVLLQVLAAYMAPDEHWPPDEEVLESSGNETHDLPQEFIDQLARSALVPAICCYLRNDSVLDMARHIPLYMCVLRCARALWSVRTRALQNALRAVPRSLRQMRLTTDSYSKLKMNKNSLAKFSYSPRLIYYNELKEDEGLANLIMDIQATAAVMCREESEECELAESIPRAVPGATREARYIEVMKRLQFETFEMIEECPDNGYRFTVSYHFESAVRSSGQRSHPARMKRLAQEAATLSTSLPLSYSSSVFVRTDTDRLDVMKVLITGPSDTPYANGCFVLDVYFPAHYPTVPMLINLETTGRHSVRFNPNLYNDGKVCLSVLNTWHGRPEEKWNAHTSSFLQVLVSIQSLILVPEPYFNEPGYERSRGTRVGTQASVEYNSNIYQACVRWAMLDHLRNPTPCFKQVIQTHFWIKRKEVMETIASWITELECHSGDKRTQRSITLNLLSLKRQYLNIQEELAKLPVPEGLEDLEEPFLLPAAPTPATPAPPSTPAPPPTQPDEIDHDMEKLVSAVLQEPAPP